MSAPVPLRPWTPARRLVSGRLMQVPKRQCDGCEVILGDSDEAEIWALALNQPLPWARSCPACTEKVHVLVVEVDPVSQADLAAIPAAERAAYLAECEEYPDLSVTLHCPGRSSSCRTFFPCGCKGHQDEGVPDGELPDICPATGTEHRDFGSWVGAAQEVCFGQQAENLGEAAEMLTRAPGAYPVELDTGDSEFDLVLRAIACLN